MKVTMARYQYVAQS